LVKHYGFRPNEITAVTFTNKAAGEMRKRLELLLGKKGADGLILGEFMRTFLAEYNKLIEM